MALMKEHLANTIWQLANVVNWKVSPACRLSDPRALQLIADIAGIPASLRVVVPQIVATLKSATRWFIVSASNICSATTAFSNATKRRQQNGKFSPLARSQSGLLWQFAYRQLIYRNQIKLNV